MKLDRELSEIRVLLEQRLRKIIRVIGQLLQDVDALFASQFFVLLGQSEGDEFDLAFFVALQLRLVRLVIFRDVLVGNFHIFLEILRAQMHDRHIHLPVELSVGFLAFRFRHLRAGPEKFLHPIERQLVGNKLLDLALVKSKRREHRLSELRVFAQIKSRGAAERRERFDELDDFGLRRTDAEALRFVLKDQSVPGKLDVIIGFAFRAHGQVLDDAHAETAGQIQETYATLKFHARNRPIVNAPEIGLSRGIKVGFVKVKNEGDGQDRDDDHEPSVMFAHYGDHKERRDVWAARAVRNLR